MEENLKQLLLKDLCARLPYMVKCKASHGLGNTDKKHEYIGVLKFVGNCYGVIANYYEDVPHDTGLINNVFYDIEYIKPYLRPMSSMTDEERDEVKEICADYLDEWENAETVVDRWKLDAKTSYLRSAFYNSHHLDWNGLIEKGLALEAPEGMYNTKTE